MQARAPSRATLRRHFQALAATSGFGSVSHSFVSPVTGQMSVAFVVPLRIAGMLQGLVHFDASTAALLNSRLLVDSVPGVHVSLAGYEDGKVMVSGHARAQPVGEPASSEPGAAPSGSHWWTLGGPHRTIVAPLTVGIGGAHRDLAVVASDTSADPDLLNSWGPGMLAVLALALVMLGGSVAALVAANRRMMRELTTDPLTRLRNRRALMEDLQRTCELASEERPAFLWFFDLNGFKGYNDSFGHLAGDALLARLGRRLDDAVGGNGCVYRLGGDEFCALVIEPQVNPLALFHQAREALREEGGAFTVDCSAGAVEIPRDARVATDALRLADQHMYRDKAASRGGTAELVTAVLHAALAQRHPELDEHSSDVAGDVELLARSLQLDDDAVELVVMAGDLHDVGKLGIPDEIISKAGPLSASEWEFMRQHTVMGERIIAAAGPSLERISPLVRASHERWDGKGYPDGLAGEAIPLGARIITICDSFRAMMSQRPYKPAMTQAEALAELHRCAGSQFDPRLVEVFCGLIAGGVATEHLRGRAR